MSSGTAASDPSVGDCADTSPASLGRGMIRAPLSLLFLPSFARSQDMMIII